jgi:hypothetical protein
MMIRRPHIPVRDGLRFPRWRRLNITPALGQVEYVAGWRWGFICGMVAGVVLAAVSHYIN